MKIMPRLATSVVGSVISEALRPAPSRVNDAASFAAE